MSDTLTAKEKLQSMVNEKNKKPLTHEEIMGALQGSVEMRNEEEKTIFLSMHAGERPSVVFTGFWNGKFVKGAMDSIAKAYRLRKYKNIRPQATIPNAVEKTTAVGSAEKKEA